MVVGIAVGLVLFAAACSRTAEQPPAATERPAAGSVSTSGAGNWIESVAIVPDPAYADMSVSALAHGTPPEGRDIQYRYVWERNGVPIPGAEQSTLSPPAFAVGDRLVVRVTPVLGMETGRMVASHEITIMPALPKVFDVLIRPDPVTAAREITAEVRPSNAGDGKALFFEWAVDDEIIDGVTKPVLGSANFKRGDEITVRVYNGPPADPERALLVTSKPALVVNSAPRIEPVQKANLVDGVRYETTVVAKDPDGDPVTFALVEGPNGMTIDPQTGLLQWTPPQGVSKPVRVAITASDGQGLSSRLAFDLSIGKETEEATAVPEGVR